VILLTSRMYTEEAVLIPSLDDNAEGIRHHTKKCTAMITLHATNAAGITQRE
jgi:hypothetical protein